MNINDMNIRRKPEMTGDLSMSNLNTRNRMREKRVSSVSAHCGLPVECGIHFRKDWAWKVFVWQSKSSKECLLGEDQSHATSCGVERAMLGVSLRIQKFVEELIAYNTIGYTLCKILPVHIRVQYLIAL
ncbi:hypothetical protein MSG28_011999 [Choristoneura fumiferana]|uniref:Uncharacterized protein n=1 Tax=Choristoneura fumiferana TaxID=7141 RepID=A0ACC0KNN4_CHOFU|nr:hypothetical protein MSG28_011999 [Choristoneura fumiferana]